MATKNSKGQNPQNQPDISGFINELAERGVQNVDKFEDQLLDVLGKTHDEKVTVRRLFPKFKKKSKEHDFLKSLSANKFVKPVGGGGWEADSITRFTKDGRAIARSYSIPVTPLVFVSYAHEDIEWKNLVMRHLGVLSENAHLESWDDNQIGIGQDFRAEIVDALELADAAVLLISADFFNSKFVNREEIPRIIESKGNDVFPILIRPCAWNTVKWLREIKVHIADGNKALSEFQNGRSISEHIPPPVETCLSVFTGGIAARMAQMNGIASD